MDAERWQRISELLSASLDLDPEAAERWLEAACAGDGTLHREVASLALAYRQSGSFLSSPAEEESWLGRQVGAYRILAEIGRGGMSIVYLAERADREYEQRVAVKRVYGGGMPAGLSERFRQERQILARLDHPNIASLLDGGTAAGLPYFVLELVEGLPIDRYCDHHRLGIAGRLRLFTRICAAVHYAHRNLVVHRDLKPGNILVAADGTPKLLDFGIAKILDGGGEAAQTLSPAWTPRYASPEQLRGEAVTTATDVYSLGVILHLLLTGLLPDPALTLPSRRIGSRQLAGDLDAIVGKALQPEPEARYGSAEELAADLQRHLERRPVAARAESWPYAAGRWAARNRLAATFAALLLCAVLGFSASSALQAQRLAQERDQAEQTLQLLAGIFEAADPEAASAGGAAPTVPQVFAAAAPRLLAELSRGGELAARSAQALSDIYRHLGLYGPAEAFARREQELRADELESLELAALHERLGELRQLHGDLRGAEPLLRQALAIRLRLLGPADVRVAASLEGLGHLLRWQGEAEAGLALFERALAIDRRLLPADDPRLLELEQGIAVALHDLGDTGRAVDLLRHILERKRAHFGDGHPEVATSLDTLAAALTSNGSWAEAEPLFERALALRRRLFGETHPAFVATLSNRGELHRRLGRLDLAERDFCRVLNLSREQEGPPAQQAVLGLAKIERSCTAAAPADPS